MPHELTVRDVPQLSFAVTEPQFLPRRVQNAAVVSGVQPHTLGTEGVAPPQLWPVSVQVPQLTVRLEPQLSVAVTVPQVSPRRAQNCASVSDTHPHTLLAPQTCVAGQVPQFGTERTVPQLSGAMIAPQVFPSREHIWGSVSGVQQTLAGEAGACEHSSPVVQPLQATAVPQLSTTEPHLPEQVVAIEARVQPHTLGVVAPHA